MIEIPLTQGKVALIDDEDAHLAAFKWHAKRYQNTYYAARGERDGPGASIKYLRLHREVLSAPAGVHVDHINGDGLDCRRGNLRVADCRQNGANRQRSTNNTSGFKGVIRATGGRSWRARISVGGQWKHLGIFDDIKDAARAYDAAALRYFGEFAKLNLTAREAA